MHADEDTEPALTTAQAAARLGVTASSVMNWVDAGLLKAWRTPGGHRRISAASVQAMIDSRRARDAANRVRPLRVMIVEDDSSMAAMLSGLVHQILPEAKVSVVGDGFQGLVQAGRQPPDLMVMDVNLPGMSGLAMIRSLRAQPLTARLRFVLVSSYLLHELKPFGELPADVPFLNKPVSLEELQDALGRALES